MARWDRHIKMTGAERQRRHRKRHPGINKVYKRRHRLKQAGLTAKSFDAIVETQGGGCAICGQKPTDGAANQKDHILHIDHCHRCNTTRGLLCNRCNRSLGLFHDNLAVLERAVIYLTRHTCD